MGLLMLILARKLKLFLYRLEIMYVEVLKIGLNLSMNETIDQDGNL